MKKIILLSIANFCFYFFCSAQTWQWTHPEPNGETVTSYPDTLSIEDDKVHDIETDAAGNVYVLGNFTDSLYLSNSFITRGNGSYLAKYDSIGLLLWYKLIVPVTYYDPAGGSRINATDLTVNSTGVYITGKYAASVYTLDCGTHITTIPYPHSFSIGNLNFTSAAGDIGFFLTKFSSSGTVVWNKTAKSSPYCDSAGYHNPYSYNIVQANPLITSDKGNNVICSFIFQNAGEHWFAIGNDIISLPSNHVPYDGSYGYPSYLIVTKYNSAGTMQWSAKAGGGFNTLNSSQSAYLGYLQDCNSLITDNNNNIFFLGTATDSTFFGSKLFRTPAPIAAFISKISSAGVWQFANELTDSNEGSTDDNQNPEKLAVDTNNNVYAVVRGSGNPQKILGTPVSNYSSGYLVKMKNSGSLTWIKSFGSNFGNTYNNSIHYNNNSLYFCGSNPAPYGLNEKLIFSQLYVTVEGGYNEFYAAKADLNGNFIWVSTFQSGYNASGKAIKALNGNIYTGGEYGYKITSLGNLNGSFTNSNPGITNLFLGKLKDQYIKVGAVTSTQLIPGCTITIPFTSTGLTFAAGNTFTAEMSDVNGYFNNPTPIGSVASTGNGSITATIPASLTYGSGYRVRIHSSDTLKTGLGYYAYADTPYVLSLVCPPPSAGFTATNITASSATVSWTSVGCASGYRIQYRVKGTTAWITAATLTTNIATYNLTGLTANTTYQWRIATRCKNNGTFSFSVFTAAKQFTTAATLSFADINDIKTNTALKVFVQPNPTSANTILTLHGNIKDASISITDFVGKALWKQNDVNTAQVDLPIQHFAAGIYLVKVVNGNETRVVKLVKQ
jgi:hypothetical protein